MQDPRGGSKICIGAFFLLRKLPDVQTSVIRILHQFLIRSIVLKSFGNDIMCETNKI